MNLHNRQVQLINWGHYRGMLPTRNNLTRPSKAKTLKRVNLVHG